MMANAPSNPRRGEERRWLCSHLVRLSCRDERYPASFVLLEEITAEEAILGVDSLYPRGLALTIGTDELEATVEVVDCQARETDFQLQVRFSGSFRWDRSQWEPDHLFAVPRWQSHSQGAGSK